MSRFDSWLAIAMLAGTIIALILAGVAWRNHAIEQANEEINLLPDIDDIACRYPWLIQCDHCDAAVLIDRRGATILRAHRSWCRALTRLVG
jgi:hypothetical protein